MTLKIPKMKNSTNGVYTSSKTSSSHIPWTLVSISESYIIILTDVGLSVSIIFLIVHLLAFAMVDDLRNLPGKNLASFSFALLLEYSSTLLSSVLHGKACFVNEIAAYYFILASAFWMLTMSFDVWQTLRCSATEFAISTGKQSKKFIMYSICSWLMPAFVMLLVFVILPIFLEEFRLDFDETKCSFLETETMYIFVESIFGTILLLNTSFFASSIYFIYSTQSAVRRSNNRNNAAFINHFRLYGRLSLIMGVTWTAEFFIYYANFDILSITFRIINTFEGLFILIAFTCRKEVLQSVRSLYATKNPHLLSFYYQYISLRRV